MSRRIFDTAAAWDALTPEEQRAIGIAAIDREIVIYGIDWIPDAELELEALSPAVEDELQNAIESAVLLGDITAAEYPLPSIASQIQRCRDCGCTDAHACEGACHWVEADLCSMCAAKGAP